MAGIGGGIVGVVDGGRGRGVFLGFAACDENSVARFSAWVTRTKRGGR